MKSLRWFVDTLNDEFGIKIDSNRVGMEANEFYLEEIDEALIPNQFRIDFPESLLFETFVYDSEEGIEWLGLIGMDTETRKWHIQVILKNGELILIKRGA